MQSPSHPLTRSGLFLAVRRGTPLALAVLALMTATGVPGVRGWCILVAVACLAEVGPTFRRGRAYLRTRPFITRWDGLWVKAGRPVFRLLGREEAWVLSFCAWNNRRVQEAFAQRKARRALVLLPHCIQMAKCKADVVRELESCYHCGLCPVEDVLAATLERRWDVVLSNRSSKAYRTAREARPDLVVAVACADRLLKGITRLPEIPCFVVPLELPHGMCVDTTFDVADLVKAMESLVDPKPERDPRIQPLAREGIA